MIKKFLLTGVFIFSLSGILFADSGAVDYSLYTDVLQKYVDAQGRVNYKALKNGRETFDRFVGQIEVADVGVMTDAEQKAFWINAYNAITLKVVLDAYPVSSIRSFKLGSVLVWEFERNVARGRYSLGDIEHKILRPLGDPRIHFAINCASIGCPLLPQKPFYPKTLDEQLDNAARAFINNPDKVWLNKEKGVLYLSSIFKWFKEDFLSVSPDLSSYVKKYMNSANREYLEQNQPKVKFLDYDWSLNEQ